MPSATSPFSGPLTIGISDTKALLHRWRSLLPFAGALPAYEDFVLGNLGRQADGAALVVVSPERGPHILWAGAQFETWVGPDLAGCGLAQLPGGIGGMMTEFVERAIVGCEPARTTLSRSEAGSVELRDVLALPLANRSGEPSVLLYLGAQSTTHSLMDAVLRSTKQGMVALSAIRDVQGRIVDLRIIALNDSAARLMRRPPDQLMWRCASEVLPNLHRTDGLTSLIDILESGGAGEFEFSYPAPDGAVHLKVSAGAIGELLAVTLTDIGDLKEREASFRLLFDDNPMPMWLYDPETLHFVSVNAAALAQYGYTREQFLAKTLLDIRPTEDHASLRAALDQNGVPLQPDIPGRHVKADGMVIEVVSRARPLAFRGKPAVLVAVTDVTDRNRYAAGLQDAKEAAEQASRAKSDFLATMSHEIRTPLNGILGYTDLLLEAGTTNAQDRLYLERILNSGAALLTVVNDVLDFSKVEAGQIELDPAPFYLAALARNALSIISSEAERKGLQVTFECPQDLPPLVVGDESRLQQVLLNFLNNAVKFTPSGGVTLRLTTRTKGGRFERIRFEVTDTGIGIPRDKQGRLFQRFSQVDGSIRREFGGTGLGLAISKRLVELMGGEIGVNSEPGVGSTFWFSVRLPHAEKPRVGAPPKGRTPERPSASILLAEDNEINQDIARTILEAAGHSVDVAGDGAAAVAAARAKRYDLVLMDIQMPVMDGMAATRQIRSPEHPAHDVPVIAMTANVLPQQVAAFRAAGMNDHIGKPFKRDELYAAIARWAGKRSDLPQDVAAVA